jgi:hypothetical protein
VTNGKIRIGIGSSEVKKFGTFESRNSEEILAVDLG